MNIEDYIAEHKDVPFTDLPFNELDNGLLSELAYMDFGGVFHDTETMVSIGDVTDRYFAEHSAEQIRKEGVFWQLAPLLLLPMKEGVRFRDIKNEQDGFLYGVCPSLVVGQTTCNASVFDSLLVSFFFNSLSQKVRAIACFSRQARLSVVADACSFA